MQDNGLRRLVSFLFHRRALMVQNAPAHAQPGSARALPRAKHATSLHAVPAGNRGNARSRQGKLQEALGDYNESIRICPWSVDPVLNRSVCPSARRPASKLAPSPCIPAVREAVFMWACVVNWALAANGQMLGATLARKWPTLASWQPGAACTPALLVWSSSSES